MNGKVVAVANMKGGVGKTTLVVALAETLATMKTEGRATKVLVIDLDAQANASMSIAGDFLFDELLNQDKTFEVFIRQGILHQKSLRLKDYVRSQASTLSSGNAPISLSLIAASPELRYVERELICTLTRAGYSLEAVEGQVREVMVREINDLKPHFDFIIFDCPPGISAFTEAILKATDLIIAPVVPDILSIYGLLGFCNRVLAAPRGDRWERRLPWVLPNRVTSTKMAQRRQQEMELEASLPDAGFRLYQTRIPQSAALVDAVGYEDPAPTYARKYGNARYILEQLAKETLEILDAH